MCAKPLDFRDLYLGVLERRDTDRLFEALGVRLFLRADLLLDALGVLLRRLDRRFLGVAALAVPSSVVFFGALGVLALRLTERLFERLLEALGVLLRLLEDLFLDDLGVLLRRLDRRFLGVADLTESSLVVFGALGVLALRLTDRLFERLLEALGVRLRRALLLREAFGVLLLRLAALRLGVADLLAASLFGAFGVLARRDEDLFLEALGVRLLLALLLREAFGVLLLRLEALRLGVADFLAAFIFGAFGVLARREEDLLLEALGVRLFLALLLREAFGVLLLRLEALRFGVADLLAASLFGAFGVLARREEDLFLDALGVRLRRLTALLLRDSRLALFGDLALRLDTDRLLEADLLLLTRFCFFGLLAPSDTLLARFFTPISLLRFSSISALYSSRAVT